jgi:hypothetical protein
MANPAKEIRQQIEAQWPGATVSKRWRNGIELAHPDNPQRRALTATIGPIHYGADESQEIDTAWLPSADAAWQWAMTENDYHAHSRDVFNAGNLIRYTHAASGHWVQFDPQSLNWRNQDNSQHQIAIKQAVAAVVEDDVLHWPGAWGAGRHFQFQCQTGRLQKLLKVDSASDLPEPTVTGDIVLELEYSLSMSSGLSFWLDGVEWTRANGVRVTSANHIECKNAAGDVLFWIAPPRAWDSAGSETNGMVQVRRSGGLNALFINVRIPRSWIETAQFPIYVDPTIEIDVAASTDDAGERKSTGATNTGAISYSVIHGAPTTGDRDIVGARFLAVTIPADATITAASTRVWKRNLAERDWRVNIYGHDTAAPSTFTGGPANADISGRTKTTASVSWTHTTAVEGYITSPDISGIIAELYADYDYSTGAAMVLIYDAVADCHAGMYTYDNSAVNAPQLHIEYTEGGDTYTGSGSASLPQLTASGTGTFTAPTYGGSGAADLPAATASGAGTYSEIVYTGTGAADLPALTASGSGTFTVPIYSGSGAGDVPATTGSGTGTHTAPEYTGSGAATLPTASGEGSGLYGAIIYSGSGAADVPGTTATGSGEFTLPIYEGSGAAALPQATASGAGTFAAVVYTGAGAALLPALAGAGAGTHETPIYSGAGAAVLSGIAGSGSGLFLEVIGGRIDYIGKTPAARRDSVLQLDERQATLAGRGTGKTGL